MTMTPEDLSRLLHEDVRPRRGIPTWILAIAVAALVIAVAVLMAAAW
jgi:hypothetical protein